MPKGTEISKNNTRLTAVTISANGKKVQKFIHLPVNNGKTILSGSALDQMLDELNVGRGDTFSIG